MDEGTINKEQSAARALVFCLWSNYSFALLLYLRRGILRFLGLDFWIWIIHMGNTSGCAAGANILGADVPAAAFPMTELQGSVLHKDPFRSFHKVRKSFSSKLLSINRSNVSPMT
jgi:hypothetical protein